MPAPRDTPSGGGPLYPCGRPLLDLPPVLELVVLGATGSIGRQTLELVRAHPDRLRVAAVACRSRVDVLAEELASLAAAFPGAQPPLVAVTDPEARERAAGLLGPDIRLLGAGPTALEEAVTAPDTVHVVVNGLVGAAGLAPTLAAARRGVRIALANKESLVVGGELVAREVAQTSLER